MCCPNKSHQCASFFFQEQMKWRSIRSVSVTVLNAISTNMAQHLSVSVCVCVGECVCGCVQEQLANKTDRKLCALAAAAPVGPAKSKRLTIPPFSSHSPPTPCLAELMHLVCIRNGQLASYVNDFSTPTTCTTMAPTALAKWWGKQERKARRDSRDGRQRDGQGVRIVCWLWRLAPCSQVSQPVGNLFCEMKSQQICWICYKHGKKHVRHTPTR